MTGQVWSVTIFISDQCLGATMPPSKKGGRFPGILLAIDMVASSKRFNSPETASAVKGRLRKAVDKYFDETFADELRHWAISFEGDGGLYLVESGDANRGLDWAMDLLWTGRRLAMDEWMAGRVTTPFQNRLLIHLGHFDPPTEGQDAGSISSPGLDFFAKTLKRDPSIGAPDHVSLSKQVFAGLGTSHQQRCVPLELDGAEPLPGDLELYVLDAQYGSAPLTVMQGDGPVGVVWNDLLNRLVDSGRFTEIDIVGHVGRTAFSILQRIAEKQRVRVLLRNPREERDELGDAASSKVRNPNPDEILSNSQFLRAEASRRGLALEMRYYDSVPWFRCAMIRGPDVHLAHFGIYGWSETSRKYGLTRPWPAALLDSRDPTHAPFLDALASRFSRLWTMSADIEVQQEVQIERAARAIWPLEGKYDIMFPVREPRSPFPTVAYEDMMAGREIENFLSKAGAECTLRPTDEEAAEPPAGTNQVFVCTRSMPDLCGTAIPAEAYWFFEEQADGGLEPRKYIRNPTILQDGRPLRLGSPMDDGQPSWVDYGIFAREAQPNGGFRYYVTGIHRIGTWAAAKYGTSPWFLLDVLTKMDRIFDETADRPQSFAVVVRGECDEGHQLLEAAETFPPIFWTSECSESSRS